jgi:DNA-binding transcriptional ArsR family regulator
MENIETINELSEFFKVFSDATRLRILEVLLQKETSVGDISNKIKVSASAVSHQLSYLRNTNLVKTRKEGQVIYYSIADNHIKVIIEYGLEHIKEGIKL